MCNLDINECETAMNDCEQNCHNTIGSYSCTCNSGFVIDVDGHTCHGNFHVTFTCMDIQMSN